MFAFDPDFSAMRLNKPLGDGQAQAHAGGVAIHSHEIFKNFLVMLRGNTRAGIGYANFHAVGPWKPETAAFLSWRHTGYTTLPKMRSRVQRDTSARGRMFQRICQRVSGGLLHLLVIKSESRNGGVETRIKFHAFALECFRPTLR